MIRDRLVCGVNDVAIQKRLLAEPTLAYEKAVELALSAETAARSVHGNLNPDQSRRRRPVGVCRTFISWERPLLLPRRTSTRPNRHATAAGGRAIKSLRAGSIRTSFVESATRKDTCSGRASQDHGRKRASLSQ